MKKTYFILLPVLMLFIGAFFVWRYLKWESTFEKDMDISNLIVVPYYKDKGLEQKIENFTLSNEDVAFLEFSPSEFAGLILLTSKSFFKEGFDIEGVYVKPKYQVWDIYMNIRYRKISLWFSFDLNKDNMQTAQLYITNLYIGPYSIGGVFNTIQKINTGIADALLTVNENAFSGRYLENIELLENTVVIKGSRY